MVKTVPLAPPAPVGPVRRRATMTSKPNSSFSWTSWLSPKVPRPSERKNNDGYDSRDGSPRSRHQPMQRPRGASFDNGRLNKERGGASYFAASNSHTLYFGGGGVSSSIGASKSTDSEDMSLITMSRSADEVDDNPRTASGEIAAGGGGGSRSLLTAFLLHLNSLLPEYCEHLSLASDTIHSNSEASKAVSVLEKGAKSLSMTFGASGITSQSSSPTIKGAIKRGDIIGESSLHSSAPNSPLYENISPQKHTTPKSDSAATRSPTSRLAPDLRHWLSPLSPRSARARLGGDAVTTGNSRSLSPAKRIHHQKTTKWNAIAESEWERFVAPFLNLAGAECFYARMEHVLDPKRSRGKECSSKDTTTADDDGEKKDGSSLVKFALNLGYGGREPVDETTTTKSAQDETEKNNEDDSSRLPLASPIDADKRGSRRLIAMYRQIREDLIIVGEYLCDPVIGARPGAEGSSSSSDKGSPAPRLPPPPLNLDSATRSPSPVKSKKESPSKCRGSNNTKTTKVTSDHTPHEQREFAAISMRNTLDALISFIDARCVLIRIHAELCNQSNNCSVESPGRKWANMAEQCQSIVVPVTAWAKEENCLPKQAVTNIEQELKALGLVLAAIDNMLGFNLFNCVLNVRRLHVLLRKISTQQRYLPLLYIKSSLSDLLAMMHIYFANEATGLNMLRGQSLASPASSSTSRPSMGPPPNRKSLNKLDDYDALFCEFISKYASGLPLAVALVRRIEGKIDSTTETQQEGKETEHNKKDGSASSWESIYMKSTLDFVKGGANNVRGQRGARGNKSAKKSGGNRAQENSDKASWPFDHWEVVENALTIHCSTINAAKPAKYNIEPENNTGQHSSSVRRYGSSTQKVMSQCHISIIADPICLITIQGVFTNKKRATDDEIQLFMQSIIKKLSPENLLSIGSLVHLKSELSQLKKQPSHSKDKPNVSSSAPPASLWSESGWSDAQRKNALQSLGLRRKQSPVMTPSLKSPYAKRQMDGKLGRRRKKTKRSINHGHLDFFLGPELSQLI